MMHVALLGSGQGSNAQVILEVWKAKKLGGAEVVGIVSDRENAKILHLGEAYEVKAQYIQPSSFKTKLEGDVEREYIQVLNDWEIDLVVLVGFMRILKPALLKAFEGRMINLHPSLLPSFPELKGVEQWGYGVKVTGVYCSLGE